MITLKSKVKKKKKHSFAHRINVNTYSYTTLKLQCLLLRRVCVRLDFLFIHALTTEVQINDGKRPTFYKQRERIKKKEEKKKNYN